MNFGGPCIGDLTVTYMIHFSRLSIDNFIDVK